MKKQTIEKPSLQELTNLIEQLNTFFLEEIPLWEDNITGSKDWIHRKKLSAIRTNISSLMVRVMELASIVSKTEYELTAVERAYSYYNKAKEGE